MIEDADWAEVVRRAGAGEASAHDELVRRFYPRVQRVVHGQLERDFRQKHRWILPLFSTRDVVQEVFAGVVGGLADADFPNEDAFVGYLCTMVRNRLLDAVRYHEAHKRDARRAVGDPDGDLAASRVDDTGAIPEIAASLAEQADILRTVLDEFTERHRELIRLRIVDEESFPSIAEKLGYASPETVRQAFVDAQARLLVKLRARGVVSDTG